MTDDQPTAAVRPTAEPITAVVADRVRALRGRAGLSQADLAEAMAARGIPWKRSTVVNLEKRGSETRGRIAGRDAVTVQELLVLALVLGVSPALLLADPRTVEKVPVGKVGVTENDPGQDVELDAWTALLWLCGMASPDERVSAVTYGRRNELIVDGMAFAERVQMLMPHLGDGLSLPELDDVREPYVRRYIESLAALLRQIEQQSAPLPVVPSRIVRMASELGVELPGQKES